MTAPASKFPHPPFAETSVSESHHLVRERKFPLSQDISSALQSLSRALGLRESSATGTLLVDINQGGIGSIRFREEKKVDLSEK